MATDWKEWIAAKFPTANPEWIVEALESEKAVLLPAISFEKIVRALRTDDAARFDSLHCLTAIDRKDCIEVVYILYAFSRNERLNLKVRVQREKPEVPSIVELYPSADWHEREVFDLFGVFFLNHPDLRRILLPDDWQGHPLRKDYVQPEFYQEWKIAAEEEHRTARPVN